nr:hypothetical protein [Catenulispora pinistramenti]
MKLRLRIGRQQAKAVDTDVVGTGSGPADRVQESRSAEAAAPGRVPVPRVSELGAAELGTSKLGTSKLGTSKLGTSESGTSDPSTSDPRASGVRVVRAGSYCRGTDVGQRAVTSTGRAVVAVHAGHCGRWAYA